MKILMVSAAYPPYISGVATATASLATWLSRDNQVTLLAGGSNGFPRSKKINDNFRLYLFPGVKIKRQKKYLTFPYPYPNKIAAIITAFKPNIIHLQDISPMGFSVLNLARKTNIPVVMTHHFTAEYIVKTLIADPKLSNRLSGNHLTQQIIYRLVNLFYNACDLLTVPNPGLVPYFKKAGLKKPVLAIPNGISTNNFRKKSKLNTVMARYGISQSQIILFVGRLEIDKNLDMLIEAFSLVHQQNPDTALVLVGDGDKKPQILKQVKKLHLENSVYLPGRIDNNDAALSHLYNAALVFATASIIENQSVAFIEAMAAGLPIVAPNLPLLTSLLKPNVNSLLFKSNNAGALAVCLQKLLSDRKLRSKISKSNRRAGRQYDIAITSRQYLQAYQSLKT